MDETIQLTKPTHTFALPNVTNVSCDFSKCMSVLICIVPGNPGKGFINNFMIQEVVMHFTAILQEREEEVTWHSRCVGCRDYK